MSGPAAARTHERCGQCGFDGRRYGDRALLDAIRLLVPEWQELLASTGQNLRTRPDAGVWSALEYAAHSRDITALHVLGVMAALDEDEPKIDDLDANLLDDTAAGTNDADLLQVFLSLADQVTDLADRADAVHPSLWTRGLTIGQSRMDVRDLLEHGLHDSTHHLSDVARGLATLRNRRVTEER